MVDANFKELLPLLVKSDVRFVLIGGGSAVVHGLARATYDVDVVYARDLGNIRRIAEALRPIQPYLRGTHAGLPFVWGEQTIRSGLNFTLTTALGNIDFLGEVPRWPRLRTP